MRSKRTFGIAILTILSIAWISVALLSIEIALKKTGRYRIYGTVYDEKLGWRLKKNYYRKESKGPAGKMHCVSTNNAGFRDREHDFSKDSTAKRIIFLGGSYTVGWHVSDEDVFVRLFEKKLKENTEDSLKYDVMNAAVSAWATDQHLLYLEQEGMKYKPDYVFLMIAPNDIRESYVKRFFYLDENGLLKRAKVTCIPWKKRFLWRLSSHFSTYQFMQQRLFKTDYGSLNNILSYFSVRGGISGDRPLFLKQRPPEVKEARYLFKALLLKMNKMCIDNNCKLILVDLPTKMEFDGELKDNLYQPGSIGKYVEEIAIENDIAFLDLFPILRLEKDPLGIFIPEEYHFDNHGHIFVAEELYDFFARLTAAGKP